jgi:hypothetical protein
MLGDLFIRPAKGSADARGVEDGEETADHYGF